MNIAKNLMQYQTEHHFDDTVLKYWTSVVSETQISHSGPYKARWLFSDGSSVEFTEERFSEVI